MPRTNDCPKYGFVISSNRNQLKPILLFQVREVISLDGMGMSTKSESRDTEARVKELQIQVEDLKELVNTLLSVICEEPDGVASGAAPSYGQPKMNYCM